MNPTFYVMILPALALALLASVALADEPYNGFKVLEVVPKTPEQLKLVNTLSALDNIISEKHAVLDWESYLTVPPQLMRFVNEKLMQHGLTYNIVYDDVQSVIDRQREVMFAERSEFDFDIYNSLEAIYAQLDYWEENCPDNLSCDQKRLGTTHEGQNIEMFKLGAVNGTDNAILVMSLVHAREWLTAATVMKIIDHWITGYGVDDDVTRMLDTYDFYIIPIDNPDGYIRSTTTDRMQSKNRSPNEGSACLGTDLNRNNDFMWGLEGVDHFPCSDLFCGDAAGSEAETMAYNKQVYRIINDGQTLWSMVDFHNYGRMWTHPWGNTVDHEGEMCARADDHDDMYHIAEVTSQAIMATHDSTWIYGTSCEVLYEKGTGATDDWAKGVANVKYPFNAELRGRGFVTDEEDIQLSFEEIWNGMVAMTDEITTVHGLSGN